MILSEPTFQSVPELVKAMEQLKEEKFAKLMAYLNHPVSQRVRTKNHVERTNWMFRLLTLNEIWEGRTPAQTRAVKDSQTTRSRRPLSQTLQAA